MQANCVEAHITTGRYQAALPRLATLVTNSKLDASNRAALRALELIVLARLGQTFLLPTRVRALREVIATQEVSINRPGSILGLNLDHNRPIQRCA